MRHASPQTTQRSYAPANVQKAAGILRERLAGEATVPRYIVETEST
jgi:hypothetical protein